jgi:ABC-2 type transport system ATP-binding protein
VVLEKGNQVKDIMTSPATLKELETYFSGGQRAILVEEEE